MRELIVGAGGFIGGQLAKRCPDATTTCRRPGCDLVLDILNYVELPECDVMYLCAGVNGAWNCEVRPQEAFAANVDAPINIARQIEASGAFMVSISSMSVEWTGGTKYQQQKLAAESVLRTMPSVGVVRAGRVTPDNVGSLCDAILRVGRGRLTGVTRWGTDEIAYQK